MLHFFFNEGFPKYGHTNVARLLVDAGWSRGARNNDGNTPQDYTDLKLCNAARDGDEATVRQYLEAGATVDWRVAGDWTALHRAAWGGHTDVARLLVDAGWSLEGRAYAGWTPLTCAAEEAQLETVKYLLLQGAQIDTQDDAEWTPLHWASYLGHTEIVRLLLMSGASEEIKSKGRRGILSFEGSTALDHAKNDETRAVFEDFKGDQGNDREGRGGRLSL